MLHKLHQISASLIGTFVTVHLFNHLLAIHSIEAHLQFMDSFRHIYRYPLVEALLLLCVAYQMGSGVYFIKNRWGQRDGFFDRLQTISGGYLAYFLLIHVGAVLWGRAGLQLDTNFYFAAAGMHVSPFSLYFLPYYFLAVGSLFSHVACGVRWLVRDRFSESTRNHFGYAIIGLGLVLSGVIVASFAGAFYPIEIPPEYRATYE